MKRRDFLLFAGAMAIAWKSGAAEAEITRIGFIQAGSRQENQRFLDTFGESLSALGWTDGKDIAVFDRWADERTEALPAIIKELIGSGVTVLVTAGTPATLAAKRASTTLPIILVAVDDPVSLGVVESLGQPGGNVTGLCLTSSEVITERLELLRELVPGLHRLAVIVRSDPGLDQKLQDVRSEARRKGIEPLVLEATTGKALELAFAFCSGAYTSRVSGQRFSTHDTSLPSVGSRRARFPVFIGTMRRYDFVMRLARETLLFARGWRERAKPVRLSHGHLVSRDDRRLARSPIRPMAAHRPLGASSRTSDRHWLAARREDRARPRCRPPVGSDRR